MSAPVILRKNARESYRLAWETYEGHEFLDLRIYYAAGEGELKPTKKGVAINRQVLPALIEALQAAQEGGDHGRS